MTDRELHIPSAAPPAHRPPASATASPDSNHEGNGSLKPAMIATRPLLLPSVGCGISDSDPQDAHCVPQAGPTCDRGRVWLDRLFAGDFTFPTTVTIPLPLDNRSAAEYDAVSRACGCRDLFVIHADPVSGERLIADLARAATDRVLILSPNPAAADRITEHLLNRGVPVLRSLAEEENPIRPSPAVSKVTSVGMGSANVDQARHEAAAALAAAEHRIAAFAVVSKAIARLTEVKAEMTKLDAELAEQMTRRNRVEAEVRSETDTPFAAALTQLKTEHDSATARLSTELQLLRAKLTDEENALTLARKQHADATRKPGFFARLFGAQSKSGSPDAVKLEADIRIREAEVAKLVSHTTELQTKLEVSATTFTANRERLFAIEIAERRGKLNAEFATTENERARAQAEAAALNKVIADAVPGDTYAAAEAQLAAAHERVAEVARSSAERLSRVVTESRVVVGIPQSLATDPIFSAMPVDPPFGLLVLDRAEELPEAEFSRLAQLAERWVLVGETLPHETPRPMNGRAPSRNGRTAEVPFVVRLAKRLDREPWTLEGDRLVCRLVHLNPKQRRGLAREPLADRPEIELRFTASESDGDPLLAEIAFPVGMGVPAAKSFLFHTLGEVLLRPCGEVVWTHEPDASAAVWPAADTSDGVWIDLEHGVREKIIGAGPFAFTAAVRFDFAAGWDAEKATTWLANCLHSPATGRFAALPRSTGSRHIG